MMPFAEVPARQPRNWFERLLWLHGRKFWMALFAGVSSFLVVVLGIWVAARTTPETGRIVEQLVSGYLFAAAGLVTAYTTGNAIVERAHAKPTLDGTAGPAAPPAAPAARASGVIQSPEATP
jgi:hypothetical protein